MTGRSEPLTAAEEELLEKLLLGERDPGDPDVAAALQASPVLREEWQRHAATAGGLGMLAKLEREVLADLDEPVPPGWEERAKRILEEQAGVRERARSPWPRRIVYLAAAAGLVLGFGLYRMRRATEVTPGHAGPGNTGDPGDFFLDGDPMQAPVPVRPLGSASPESLAVFEWAYEPEGSDHAGCQVVVYSDDAEELATSPVVLPPTPGERWEWRPSPAEIERMLAAESFRWRVSARSTYSPSSPFSSVTVR